MNKLFGDIKSSVDKKESIKLEPMKLLLKIFKRHGTFAVVDHLILSSLVKNFEEVINNIRKYNDEYTDLKKGINQKVVELFYPYARKHFPALKSQQALEGDLKFEDSFHSTKEHLIELVKDSIGLRKIGSETMKRYIEELNLEYWELTWDDFNKIKVELKAMPFLSHLKERYWKEQIFDRLDIIVKLKKKFEEEQEPLE